MQVAVFGINLEHTQVPISEKLIAKIKYFLPYFEIIPLVTCNRFEVYINSSQNGFLQRVFYDFLKDDFSESLLERSYLYFSFDCFYHLCKTTSGLDSAILGESEIQHQVKVAYLKASKKKLPFCLHFLFQKALKIGKLIRTQYLFQNTHFKLAALIWEETKKIYKDPSVLLVGKSQINNSIKNFFIRKKINKITISTRYPDDNDSSFLPFSELNKWVNYDIVICGTKYNHKCILPMPVNKKVFLFDLSVPSVVDLTSLKNKNVIFWSLNQINSYFLKHKNTQLICINKCLNEIEKQVISQKEIYKKKERNRIIFQKKAS